MIQEGEKFRARNFNRTGPFLPAEKQTNDNGQGSLNYPFWGDQTMNIYGTLEGISALFGLVI